MCFVRQRLLLLQLLLIRESRDTKEILLILLEVSF